MNCIGSNVLPAAENASVYADAGHEEHAELAGQLADGTLPDWISAVIPAGSRSEVALAYDTATRAGRVIGENLGRAYGTMAPFEACGSCDVVGIDGDAVVIIDFKTGHNEVEPARTNAQLAFYATAAASAFGKSSARVVLVYTAMHRIDSAELDAFDLAEFADRLEALHVRVSKAQLSRQQGEPVETREGSWCRYCPSKPFCGSKNALLVQLAEHGLAIVGDSVMTPERARLAYSELQRIDQLVGDAKKRLNTYVDEHGPIDLGDGRRYGRYARQGNEVLDGAVAVQAIHAVVGESAKEFEAMAIERRTSKAAIDRAAKAIGAKRGTAPAVIKKIRELGGATRKAESYPYGEFTAGNDAELPPSVDYDAVDRLLKEAG